MVKPKEEKKAETKERSITEVLHEIQQALKVPKGQKNKHLHYNYRSCEDILNAVKPLLPEGFIVCLDDELVQIGDRYYVKAQALLGIGEKARMVTAYAREAQEKKGLDVSQITGSASSYARKYALSGLFGIGSEKDADSGDNSMEGATNKVKDVFPGSEVVDMEDDVSDQQPPKKDPPKSSSAKKGKISEPQRKRLFAISKSNEWSNDKVKELIYGYGKYESTKDIDRSDYEAICNVIEGKEPDAKQEQGEHPF